MADGATAVIRSAYDPPPPTPTTKNKRGDRIMCSRCEGSSADFEWAATDSHKVPIGDDCKHCWMAFTVGRYFVERSWEAFCYDAAGSGDFNDEIDDVIAAALGAEPTWEPADIRDTEDFELTIARPFIAIPRADFHEMAGVYPADCGIAEIDLKNELGQTFKGALIQHPHKPWLEYNLSYKTTLSSSRIVLGPTKDVRSSLASTITQNRRQERETGALLTKLRNCTLTGKQVEKMVGKEVFGASESVRPLPGGGSGAIGSTTGSSTDPPARSRDAGHRMGPPPSGGQSAAALPPPARRSRSRGRSSVDARTVALSSFVRGARSEAGRSATSLTFRGVLR